jgi:ParB family transcriptional regulator, chromosome partitioning protein
MKPAPAAGEVRMIDVTSVEVLNPRERNDKVFDEIVVNIKRVGLKKPITVTPRESPDGGERYPAQGLQGARRGAHPRAGHRRQ